jgi:hypothetical protein
MLEETQAVAKKNEMDSFFYFLLTIDASVAIQLSIAPVVAPIVVAIIFVEDEVQIRLRSFAAVVWSWVL